MSARWHEESVHLGLDVLNALGVLLQPRNVDLDIEVTNVYKNQQDTWDKGVNYLLQTIASLGIFSKWEPTKMSLHPVVVTKICPSLAALSMVMTWYPDTAA